MKLTYWYSQCPDDSDRYSVRTRTLKEAKAEVAGKADPAQWETPRKVTVEYDDGYELMWLCSVEGSHHWECS